MNIIKMFAKNEVEKKEILIKLKTENRAPQTSMTHKCTKAMAICSHKIGSNLKKNAKNYAIKCDRVRAHTIVSKLVSLWQTESDQRNRFN